MILSEIKNYLRQVKAANIIELSRHFDIDCEALRAMLDIFIRKGHICRKTKTPVCGSSCSKCSPLLTEIYLWNGDKHDNCSKSTLLINS